MTQLDNEIAQELDRPRGGRWVKNADFSERGQRIGGVLRDLTVEDRTDDKGNVVKVRGKDKVRKIYRVLFEIPEAQRDDANDDGLRIWDANEAGQTAIREAYKKAGTKELIGGQFKARVVTEKPAEYDQATYEVELTAAPKTVDLPDADADTDW